jgi:biopolymer transport protein ExbD
LSSVSTTIGENLKDPFMPLKTSASEELPSINLTPMIDVVFLLIIFFMVGTQFTQPEREIALKLPGVGGLSTMVTAPDRLEITVTADERIVLDGQTLSVEQLVSKLQTLRARYPDLRVAVRADRDVRYHAVTTVMGAANRAGISDLTTAVRSTAMELR